MGFYLIYSGQKCNCGLKIVNQWDKSDNNVTCTGKEIKSGLKLVRTETDVTTGYQYSSFVNFCKIMICPKTWAYCNMKSGWLKTSARKNMGPQNNTYLSVPKEFKMMEIIGIHLDKTV